MLSILLILPIIAIIFYSFIPLKNYNLIKGGSVVITFIQLLISVTVYLSFDKSIINFQFVENYQWFSLNIINWGIIQANYHVGVDGLNVTMLLLAGIVMFIGSLASWNISENRKGYHMLYMLLSSSVFGCFIAIDLLLFFIFFEFMLLPMYFLIGIWGGIRREYAAIKFFLYTLLGSVGILLVMVVFFMSTFDPIATAALNQITDLNILYSMIKGNQIPLDKIVHSANLLYATSFDNYLPDSLLNPLNQATFWGWSYRSFAFIIVIIGLAIKLPIVPFHTWLPDAHVEAPTSISVVLAGILLKIGGYGMMRLGYAVFYDVASEFSYLLALLGVLSIIWASMNAIAQLDLKKMIAYSSVAHMGFVILGLASYTAEGFSGAIYQMFSHGVISSLLFIITGILYERTHDRTIENYRGLAMKLPKYTAVVMIAFFASFGLPGFSGFIAEFFVFLGAFSGANNLNLYPLWLPVLATSGIVLGAVYYLWTLQRMFFGKFWVKKGITWKEGKYDLSSFEILMTLPLVFLSILYGIFPSLILDYIEGFVTNWHLISKAIG